ncbi:hypothetical protein SynA1524_02129 [Synechococcus sp. A15-24]|nr:hypothetical protein SynA1524_02129 [Synechococcus sp. A15-24]
MTPGLSSNTYTKVPKFGIDSVQRFLELSITKDGIFLEIHNNDRRQHILALVSSSCTDSSTAEDLI